MKTKHGFEIHQKCYTDGINWTHLWDLVDLGNKDWALIPSEPYRVHINDLNPKKLYFHQRIIIWGEYAEIPLLGKVPVIRS